MLGNNVAPGSKLAPLSYADDDAVRYAELFDASGIETELLVVPDRQTKKWLADLCFDQRVRRHAAT